MSAPLSTEAKPQDRGVARKHAFLEAAREVFLEQGYEAASVNEVVRRAGGSLATLYAQFGSKEGLFQAVVLDQFERFSRNITPERVDTHSLEAGLTAMGRHFVRALLQPDHLAFYRLIVGEARKFPLEIQRYVAAGGAASVRSVIGDFLRAHRVGGPDFDLSAAQFIELCRSRHHYAALADPAYRVSDAELDRDIGAAVQVFLNGAPRT